MQTCHLSRWSGSVRYVDVPGDDPPTVFVTGMCLSSLPTFAPAVMGGGLLAGRRMLFVDPFGCGFSDAPRDFGYRLPEHADVIAAVLEHAGATHVTLVGFSMGGSIATLLAERGAPLVRRLIVIESNLDPGTGTLSPTIAAMDERDFERTEQAVLAQRLSREREQGLLALAGFLARSPGHAVHRSARALVEPLQPSLRARLANLELDRTCVIRGGGEGSELTEADAAWLTANDIEVRVVPEAGHMLMWDRPRRFTETLRAALAEP